MRPETLAIVDEIKQSLSLCGGIFDWDKATPASRA